MTGFRSLRRAASSTLKVPWALISKSSRGLMTEVVTAADFQKIEGGPLLVAAYAVVWGIFFAGVLFVFWRIRKVESEVRKLEARLAERPGGPPGQGG